MEDIKKRGRGRPRKGDESPHKEDKPKGTRGGRREGAGRKAKGATSPLVGHVTFRTTEATVYRTRMLREMTKNDAMPFNRMFEKWVEEYARDYGIE